MVYGLFRLGRLSHVKVEAGRVVLKLLNQLFHVEHFMFEFDRLVQALKGKDEEKEIHESLKHGFTAYSGFRVINRRKLTFKFNTELEMDKFAFPYFFC
ncbi:MAG: hypothetical protein LBI95_02280 [Holosporales bacterium]|jgi:hypothetical protein|nr:hypothetical protein [Holosporales bacterium]